MQPLGHGASTESFQYHYKSSEACHLAPVGALRLDADRRRLPPGPGCHEVRVNSQVSDLLLHETIFKRMQGWIPRGSGDGAAQRGGRRTCALGLQMPYALSVDLFGCKIYSQC
jgi:hypothetical protein